jgi:hypothetical protein
MIRATFPMSVEFTFVWEEIEVADDADHITEEAMRVFRMGQCHSLAIALHRLTGAPLMHAFAPDLTWWHAGVAHRERFIDVAGAVDLSMAVESPDQLLEVQEQFYFQLWNAKRAFRPQPEDARPWALLVARREGMDLIPTEGDDA